MALVSYYTFGGCHKNCIGHPAFSVCLFFYVFSVIVGGLQFLFYSA